jgi:DNA-binding transcriptional MerR regulator
MQINSEQLTIGKLAKQTGLTAVAIRHYERIGLIKAKRSSAKYRLYSIADVTQLVFIKNAQEVGFSLKEISSLLNLINSEKVTSKIIKDHTLNKIKEVKSKIKTLKNIQHILEQWAGTCDGKVPIEKCLILKQLYKPSHKAKRSIYA